MVFSFRRPDGAGSSPAELDAVRIVNDAVQDRIAEVGSAMTLIAIAARAPGSDQQGALVVAIIDDLEQIAALVGGEQFGSQSSRMRVTR